MSCRSAGIMPDKITIVVTGFGPFGEHQVNASSVAVKELTKLDFPDYITIVTEEIPVQYEAVNKIVPLLWKKYHPKLMIHVGVSSIATELTLEQQGHNNGYDKPDVCSAILKDPCCIRGGPDCILSRLNMADVCGDVNKLENVKAVVSYSAGRYLCGYTYYKSLHHSCTNSAFIHVPPLNEPYTGTQLAMGIKKAALSMLKQVSSMQNGLS